MGWKKRLAFAIAGVELACGSSGSSARHPTDGEPTAHGAGEIRAQFEREAEPIQKHVVQGGEAFSAYIEASGPPTVERGENHLRITANIWESTIQCFVYDDAIDTGSASTIMIREAAKSVKFQKLAPYLLDHHGIDPIVAIRGIYHVERDGEVAAGDYKLLLMPRLDYPVLCVHDAPGYAQSFARVTGEFAKSFKYRTKQPNPTRGELWAITLEDTPVGFSRQVTFALEDGDVQRMGLSAHFLPIAPGEISFEDTAEIVTSDRDGKIKRGKYLGFENGESSLQIDLERTTAGYDYVGTIQAKEVKGSFKSKQPLKGQYALEKRLKSLAGKPKKTEFEQWEYIPELDAGQSSKVSYEIATADGGFRVVSRLGKRGMSMEASDRGVLRRGEISVGSKNVAIVLVEETGEL